MKKMLMISIELPYPPSSGGRMKSWNLVNYLSRYYEFGLACPLKYGTEYLADFREKTQLRHFLSDRVEIPRSAKSLATSYLKMVPLNVHRSGSADLKRQIAAVADEYDIIFLDHYESLQYLPEGFRGQVIFHTHNATYLMWERYADSDANLVYRAVTAVEARRVRRYENAVCERADLIFASPNDIDSLVAIGCERSKFRVTYHLGDDSQLALEALRFEATEKALLYVGLLNWEANVDGLMWFLEEIWPDLLLNNPDLEFWIAGGSPDPRLIAKVDSLPGVSLLGFVEDLEPLFSRARLFMAPLRFGSGIKVKVLNAMCRGLPTITTSVGSEGLVAKHMEHLSITDNAADMRDAVSLLLTDQAAWDRLQEGSRALVREHYTWEKVLGYMVSEIEAQAESQHETT
ncbi:MAG: glycosyltransferase [Pontibacterium sp.]